MDEHPDLVSFILDKIAKEFPTDAVVILTPEIIKERFNLIKHHFDNYIQAPFSNIHDFMICVKILQNIANNIDDCNIEETIYMLIHRLAYEPVSTFNDFDEDLRSIESICLSKLA